MAELDKRSKVVKFFLLFESIIVNESDILGYFSAFVQRNLVNEAFFEVGIKVSLEVRAQRMGSIT